MRLNWVLCVWAFLVVCQTALAEWQVWTVSETRRVLRDEAPGTGLAVKLAAARNEWQGFQILTRSAQPIKGINLEAGNLNGPGNAVIAARDARLYRQHQIEITEPTHRNDAFKPGWYPDPLIPFRHPVTGEPLRGGRYAAVPFDLPANETHGFWVDIAVPIGAPPGDYRGTYRVTAEGQKPVEIPVTLTVWAFSLPRVSTLVTAFGSPADRMRDYYRRRAKAGKDKEPGDWAAVEAQCAAMLSEHRFNATPPAGSLEPVARPDGSFEIPAEQIAAFRDFVDRYHVNAFCTPHPSSAGVKDPEAEKPKLHAWLRAWDRAAAALGRPAVLFYTYLKDEPNKEEEYRYVQAWGKAVREAKSVVKVLVVEQTKTQDEKWGDLYGAVDIWCPLFSLHDPETAAQRQALGEMVWTYTALCQLKPTPWWHIDYPLLHYRVPAWMAWRYRMTGLLYWGGMSYWNQVEDPWTEAWTYGRQKERKGLVYNGEGTLVYPARPVGYEGIVPSLRLKALRDSIQDYEYFAILERAGLAEKAQEVVLAIAPSFFEWDKDPAAYAKARSRLAELILGAK